MIKLDHIDKVYYLYDKPSDRFKEAISITKQIFHKEHYALKDISLEIKKGDSVGIIGKNGSGKSTLLKIITGVLNPTSGNIQINGKIAALLELGAGFNPEYTGIENIYLNGIMMGYSRAEMEGKISGIVDFADIGEFIYQPVKTYSSGMFARLAFAVSINVEPEILIVDEALSVGDTRFQLKCIDKMEELKNNGTTILFVSHATEQIKRFCNKAIWLQNGIIKKCGEASQLVDIYENYMHFGEKSVAEIEKTFAATEIDEQKNDKTEEKDLLAKINYITINKEMYQSFEPLLAEVEYEIYEEEIEGFLLGVAIYSADRKHYIFGPNTYLDKIHIPNTKGKHRVRYTIPEIQLIHGQYVLDVGIFNNKGIVNFDYKMSAVGFSVSNKYFSEGDFYMEHDWLVLDKE
ncbi:MAG: ABC transporter ATP-binding protein [Clostridiales bacterium]|nr:ABC transporter ATP-binding protein [Clostridiales bacterium]